MKILIIEDELQLLNNIKESLEKENFLIETAMDFSKKPRPKDVALS